MISSIISVVFIDCIDELLLSIVSALCGGYSMLTAAEPTMHYLVHVSPIARSSRWLQSQINGSIQ